MIDFGISRAAEAASVTGVGLVVGSPGFMSPEQAMGEEIGPPSDIFSLGAVLAFAATGGGPFGQGSRPELAYRLVYGPPDLGQLPAGLRPLVERCLAKDPGQRPTADEVLAAANAGQPVPGWLPAAAAGATLGPPAGPPEAADPPRAARAGPPAPGAPLAAAADGGGRDDGRREAGVIAASVAVSLALSGAAPHSSDAGLAPQAEASATSTAAPPGGPRDASGRTQVLHVRAGTAAGHRPRGGHGHVAGHQQPAVRDRLCGQVAARIAVLPSPTPPRPSRPLRPRRLLRPRRPARHHPPRRCRR